MGESGCINGWNDHRVARPHRFVGKALDFLLLLVKPCRLDVRFDLLEGRCAAGLLARNENEVPAVARLNRASPGAGVERKERLREFGTELPGDLIGRAVSVLVRTGVSVSSAVVQPMALNNICAPSW